MIGSAHHELAMNRFTGTRAHVLVSAHSWNTVIILGSNNIMVIMVGCERSYAGVYRPNRGGDNILEGIMTILEGHMWGGILWRH